MVIPTEFRLFSGTENPRNSVPIPSAKKEKKLRIPFRGTKKEANFQNSVPNHSAEESTTLNSVTLNQNRRKLSEFCSKPFRGREHNSEFLSVQQKVETISRNTVPNHSAEEKPTTNKRGSQNFQK